MFTIFKFAFLFFFALYAFVFLRSFFSQFRFHHREVVNVYFGIPGSGKTTYAAYLAKIASYRTLAYRIKQKFSKSAIVQFLFRNAREPLDVYSNVPILGTYQLDPLHDLGFYLVSDGKIIIDEAGIEYNNRNFKTFPQDAIYWFKYHRHYECSVKVFSQSYEDMDVTLRRLAQNYYVVKKSLIPYCIVFRQIKRKVGIDDNTHQIIDKYYFLPLGLGSKRIFCPPLWKLFNSYSRREMPEKEWTVW